MEMDEEVCSRARLARDARFDGKFYIAVTSTGIYCRPICRSRASPENNVRYFPTAAAAAAAGFRPCLRCRPEGAPGTPAWAGTQTTVSRALRLIAESWLAGGGVEGLAERLGVSARHLRRLFLRHAGATPKTVAQTRRLQFAKKLLDETDLPMHQIAAAAGFGCLRRFNGSFRKVYHRTPTELRRLARQAGCEAANQYRFHLSFRPPYNWTRMREYLAARAVAGVEALNEGSYRRTIELGGSHGVVDVSFDGERNALTVGLECDEPRALFPILQRVRAIFDLDADWTVIAKTLGADRTLARRVEEEAGLRVPGCWSGFELTTRAILGEQANPESARGLAGAIAGRFGREIPAADGLTRLFPTAEVLAQAEMAGAGTPRGKAEAIRALARAVCEKRIHFEGDVNRERLFARLEEIPGIEHRTAEYVAMRALGDPDAFPCGAHGSGAGAETARQFEKQSEAWRPWRAYGVLLLELEAQGAEPRAVELRERSRPKTRAGKAAATK